MSYSQACCTIKPVESNYQAKGTIENIGDLSTYVVGPDNAKHAIVIVYDIFGLKPNTQQFADLVATRGYKVFVPDFLRGDYCDPKILGDKVKLIEWVTRVGSKEVIFPMVNQVVGSLRERGFKTGGFIGFCWGAKICVEYSAVDSPRFFAGLSLIHPSFVDVKDAETAMAPILAIPSKDEPDMTEYMEVLYKKPFGSLCKHVRFDDMPHGFAAARGDYTDELNVKRTTEAIQLTVDFFEEAIINQSSL
ncbi:Alpha/Beta hydrolase protein [Cunninghamella echinulata]|nr:Alpha/Beta hydrolase protein [Cunninghamella echinulata]